MATMWVQHPASPAQLAMLPAALDVRHVPAEGPLPESLGPGDILVPSFDRRRVREVIPRIEGLRVIQTLSAGIDWILPSVPPGVLLCDAAGVHDVSVAEWTVAVILAVAKQLPLYVEQQRRAEWRRPAEQRGTEELNGSVVLILGHGAIGRAVERMLAGFDVEVLRVARQPREGVHGVDALPALLPRADVVVVLLPLTDATRGMVDAAFLAAMRSGALLVNAGRGALVDTGALVEAARRGHVRAALDVVDPEPLPHDHPLWSTPGVLLTPHVAGSTPRFMDRGWQLVAAQAERYLRGEPLLNVVTDGY